jgi:hypothetical protein
MEVFILTISFHSTSIRRVLSSLFAVLALGKEAQHALVNISVSFYNHFVRYSQLTCYLSSDTTQTQQFIQNHKTTNQRSKWTSNVNTFALHLNMNKFFKCKKEITLLIVL